MNHGRLFAASNDLTAGFPGPSGRRLAVSVAARAESQSIACANSRVAHVRLEVGMLPLLWGPFEGGFGVEWRQSKAARKWREEQGRRVSIYAMKSALGGPNTIPDATDAAGTNLVLSILDGLVLLLGNLDIFRGVPIGTLSSLVDLLTHGSCLLAGHSGLERGGTAGPRCATLDGYGNKTRW